MRLERTRHWLAQGLGSVAAALAGVLAFSLVSSSTVKAVSIELRGVAPDRIERQRVEALGKLPIDNTPDLGLLRQRLAAAGLKKGAAMFLRIFKQSSELEVWLKNGERYSLFATYPICQWSGTLGPKLREGDKQTPEGFYTVTRSQLRRRGRWPRSINLGFPNAFDRSLTRTGSYILVHGGCSSVGCFAMTNPVIHEIHLLARAATRKGQRYIPVHLLPFRMTDENLTRHADSKWSAFWNNLREGYDAFEQTRIPPKVTVCNGRYMIERAVVQEPADDEAALSDSEDGKAKKRKSRQSRWPGPVYKHCPKPKLLETSSIERKDPPTKQP